MVREKFIMQLNTSNNIPIELLVEWFASIKIFVDVNQLERRLQIPGELDNLIRNIIRQLEINRVIDSQGLTIKYY